MVYIPLFIYLLWFFNKLDIYTIRVGGPFIITSYDYDVALDEYGLPNEPKYSHFSALHNVLHQYADSILSSPVAHGIRSFEIKKKESSNIISIR